MLHAPFVFENISITPSIVDNVQDYPATLKFTIPSEAEYLLPFNVYITSAQLTPEFGNIEVVYDGGVYRYKWKVTSIGEQTINFKTNTASATEVVFIEAELFERGEVAYFNSSGINFFSNVSISPNPLDFGVGKAVRLKFTVPTAGVFEIHTSNLDPVNGSVVGGVYTYSTAVAGEQIIDFFTNKKNSNEIIKLKAVSYQDNLIRLKNQLVNVSGRLTYHNSNRTLRNGVVTASVDDVVVGIFTTNNSGEYSASFEVDLDDELTFSYVRNNSTYEAANIVVSATMVINSTLYR